MKKHEIKAGIRVVCVNSASYFLTLGSQAPRPGEYGTIRPEVYADPGKKLVYVQWDAGFSLGVRPNEIEKVK